MPAFEQIRRDLDASPSDVANWEASCLKDVASLLESLEKARAEWQALVGREHRVRDEVDRTREQLAAARREADSLREQGGRTAFAESAAAAALERVAELERRVADARAQAEAAETDLVKTKRERDVLAENEQQCAGLKAEAAELRTRLKRAEGARKELQEERDRAAAIEKELDRTRREVTQAKRECEQQMVLACDLGVKLNRLEKERDEAADHGKKKLRAVLDKVHEALDAAGAPRGDDLSYGDRLRWLAARLEERGSA